MEFIATHWYIGLIVMMGGYGYALFNQLRRMKEMESFFDSDIEGSEKDLFFKGFGKMVVSGLIGSCGLIFLIIAIIMNIIIAIK